MNEYPVLLACIGYCFAELIQECHYIESKDSTFEIQCRYMGFESSSHSPLTYILIDTGIILLFYFLLVKVSHLIEKTYEILRTQQNPILAEIDFIERTSRKIKPTKPRRRLDFEEENESLQCLICKVNKKVWSFQPCGHVIACHSCYDEYKPKREKCPLCMQECNNWITVRI